MATSSEDLFSIVAKHIREERHILFEELIPNYDANEVFPKNLQQSFKVLFRKLFDTSRIPDIIKSEIRSLLQRYLPEYPEMCFLWNGPNYGSKSISDFLKIHPPRDLHDVIEFFQDEGNVHGFKNDVGDWIQEYVDLFLTNHFDKSVANLVFEVGDMIIQTESGVQIKSLKDYYCALTGFITFSPESMSRLVKTKYRPYLTFYFRLRLMHEVINKIVSELFALQNEQ